MKSMLLLALAGAALLAVPSTGAAQDPGALAEGAQVWAKNCTRCHGARASTERTDRDWLTIVAHMRARANLTRSEAAVVAVFLAATNDPMPTVNDIEPEAAAPDSIDAPASEGRATRLTPEQRRVLLNYLTLLRRP